MGWYKDANGNPVWRDAAGPVATPVGPRNPELPGKIAQTNASTAKTNNDIAVDNATLALRQREAAAKEKETAANLALKGLEIGPDGKPRRMAAIPLPPELTPKVREDAISNFNSAQELGPIIAALQKGFDAGPAKTTGLAGIQDWLPGPQNQAFNNAGDQLRGFVKRTQGITGGEANTATESKMSIGAFLPSTTDFDTTTQNKINSLRREKNRSIKANIAILGGIPDSNGQATPVPAGYRVGQYPDLDSEIAGVISSVPLQNRQSFILDAKKRFEAKQAMRKVKGASKPAASNVIDWNDWKD